MPLVALILIVSASLLSGAKNLGAQSLTRPSQSLPQQGNKASKQAHFDSKQRSSAARIEQATPPADPTSSQARAKQIGENRDRDSDVLREVKGRIAAVSVQDVFTCATTIATILLAVFTWKLVLVTRDMRRTAEATTEVARKALHADRPYLLVTAVTRESFKHPVLGNQEPISRARITLRNVGSSPAELLEIYATAWKFDCFPQAGDPRWETLIFVPWIDIAEPVVAVGQDLGPIPVVVNWTKDDIDLVNAGVKRVAIYGLVKYRSGSKEPYYTRFFWWFSPLTEPSLKKAAAIALNERS